MPIDTLIDKVDSSELVRDVIASILVTESAAQQALATTAERDTRLWALRVFLERSNPWSEFRDGPAQLDSPPIVNVALENTNYDPSASNVVEHQKGTAVFNIDCFGYGVAEDDGAGGHIAADRRASLEAQRAVRLVRNILMSAEHAYLGLRGTVWRRWVRSVQMFQPQIELRAGQHVVAARIAFEVWFSEVSPQIALETLEELGVTIEDSGEVLLEMQFGESPPP